MWVSFIFIFYPHKKIIWYNFLKIKTVGYYMNNKDFAKLIDDTIKKTGVTKTHIAKKLNVSRQQIDNILAKRNFSVDDANKLLNAIDLEIDEISIKKIEKNQ